VQDRRQQKQANSVYLQHAARSRIVSCHHENMRRQQAPDLQIGAWVHVSETGSRPPRGAANTDNMIVSANWRCRDTGNTQFLSDSALLSFCHQFRGLLLRLQPGSTCCVTSKTERYHSHGNCTIPASIDRTNDRAHVFIKQQGQLRTIRRLRRVVARYDATLYQRTVLVPGKRPSSELKQI
jgi:hypothetical protein